MKKTAIHDPGINRDNFYDSTQATFKKASAPDREPDFISYRRHIQWVHPSEYDEYVMIDEETGLKYICVDDDFELTGFAPSAYRVINEIIGKSGDIGIIYETDQISSVYHYTKYGVFRTSDHWGKVKGCMWDIESDEYGEIAGFCYWSHFTNLNLNSINNASCN